MDILNLDYLHLFNLAKDQAMTIDKDIIFAFSVGTLIGSAIILIRRFFYSFKYPYVATNYMATPESRRLITTVNKIISKAPLIPVFNAKLADFVRPKDTASKGLKKYARKRIDHARVPVMLIHAQTHRPVLIMFDLPGNKSTYLSKEEIAFAAKAVKATNIPVYSPKTRASSVQEDLHHISNLLKASELPATEVRRSPEKQPIPRQRTEPVISSTGKHNHVSEDEPVQVVHSNAEPIEAPIAAREEPIIHTPAEHAIDNKPTEPLVPESMESELQQPAMAMHPKSKTSEIPSDHLTKKWFSAAKLKSKAISVSPRVDTTAIKAAASRFSESTRHAVKRASDSIDEASRKMDTSVGNSSNPGIGSQPYAEPEFAYEDLDDPLEAEMRAAKNGKIAVKPNREFFPEDHPKDEEYSLFGGGAQAAPINRRITNA